MIFRPRYRPPRRIVLAVTSAQSLALMKGFPEYLAGHGWDVHVVYSGVWEPQPQGVTGHALSMRREPSPAADFRALAAWVQLLWELKPTAVVAGTPKAGLLGTLAARVTSVPVRIYMLRGLRLETEKGLRRKLLHGLEWVSAWASTKVLAVSPSLLEEFVGLGLCPRDKVVVLGDGSSNGVEVLGPLELERLVERTESLRVDLGLPADRPTIGFVGRLSSDKGLPVLLEALHHLHTSGHEAQLLAVGPEEPPNYLDKALHQVALSPAHIFRTGAVSDVAPYYGLMDVLCLPTKREGFPNVVLEASTHGIPSVVSNVTGAVDSVVDGETGFHFRCGDADELAGCLRTMTEDASRRNAMGMNARDRAVRRFERSHVWRETEAFLQAQLSGNHREKVGR